jgi:hypothetical protein
MPGRALVVGAVVGEIRGVENDVRAVAAFLERRGFAVTALDPRSEATRDAILAAYNRLIDDVPKGSDEPAVVYYAGHGGIVVNAHQDDPDPALPDMFQCIIPVDYARGSETDFRGITSLELSALQRRLAGKTRNVTVILDCCHSGHMSRGGADSAIRPRALAAPTRVAMRRHLDVLRARYPDLFARPATSNPTAVRVVACGERESAWPIRDEHGEWYGAFTRALLDTLGAINGAAVTWEEVGTAIAGRVQSSYPGQQPRVEGPRHRRVFSLEEVPVRAIAIKRAGRDFVLDAGALAGVTAGDVYAIVEAGAARELARVRVSSVTPLTATAVLAAGAAADAVPGDAIAVPRELAVRRRPLRVATDSLGAAAQVGCELAATLRVRATTDGDTAALAHLTVRGSELQLLDTTGPLLPPLAFPDHLAQALEVANRLAVARDLLDLEGEHGVAADELAITWGVVEDGRAVAQPAHGTVLTLDAPIYVIVRNAGSRTLFVHVLNIGVHGHIALLSEGTGMQLAPGQQTCLGNSPDDRELVGLELSWPSALPRDVARLDTIVVIATTRPADLRLLATSDRGLAAQRMQAMPAPGFTERGGTPHEAYVMTTITYLIDPRMVVPVTSR